MVDDNGTVTIFDRGVADVALGGLPLTVLVFSAFERDLDSCGMKCVRWETKLAIIPSSPP